MLLHVRNYYKHFNYDESDTILCECCGVPAVDIHHIESRSSFGSLIALCRKHHDYAHGERSKLWKITFKEIIAKRN